MIATILQWNTDGLISKWYEARTTLATSNAHIICIQETHLKPTDPYKLNINSYSLYRKDHEAADHCRGRRGGVCTYIKNDIPHRLINHSTTLDILIIEIQTTNTPITIINFYFPPETPDNPSITTLISTLNDILEQINTPIILCGDVNAHHALWEHNITRTNKRGRLIHDALTDSHLVCLNSGTPTLPARQITHSDTTPDITFASPNIATTCQWETGDDPLCSDHLPIYIHVGVHFTPLSTFPRWNMKKANWTQFTDSLELSLNSNTTPDTLTKIVLDTANATIPHTKQHHNKPRAAPWWNSECSAAIKSRNKARHRHEKYRTQATLSEYKHYKAKCKQFIKKAKKESWEHFISTFNRFTPISKIWQIIKAFKGVRTSLHKSITIKYNDVFITNHTDIVNMFAEHYLKRSSDLPSPIPNNIELQTDTYSLDYNTPFTIEELNLAINRTGNSCPGPDEIHYHFFRHMGPTAKTTLLAVLNKVFISHEYPGTWLHAHIIPILKPNKDPTLAESYRPISLTSCYHKIFERMVKERLLYFIQSRKILSNNQSGFLPNRNTTDNLVKLTADIQNAFALKKYTAALFLDLKQAYDTLDITTLLTHIRKIGITGHTAHYLNYYLCHRTFQVKHAGQLSDTKHPTTGLMQGSVLSPILFILALDSALHNIPPPTQIAIYADDIALWTTHKHHNNALGTLQRTLDHIGTKLQRLNLNISPDKSKCILFGRVSTSQCTPLTIQNTDIPFTAQCKFLGITLDKHLTFNHHIQDITNRTSKRINILKATAGTTWGGDRATLTKLYESLIRPVMEYASIIFENAAQTHLKKLNSLQNTCLRIITGALRTSPIEALHVYNNTTPLADRRTEALFKYFFKVQQTPNHPCVRAITRRSHPRYRRKTPQHNTIGNRLTQHVQALVFPLLKPHPHPPPLPWWNMKPPTLALLLDTPKHNYIPAEITSLFHEYISQHPSHTLIFTDGSKHSNPDRTGAAAIIQRNSSQPIFEPILRARLPNNVTIFTVELYAILAAYAIIEEQNLQHTIIISDSKSALTAINPRRINEHPIISQIINIHIALQDSQVPKLLWIPSHVGITGNELADHEANKATLLNNHIILQTTQKEYFSQIHSQIQNKLQLTWNHSNTQLHSIHPKLELWDTTNQNSKLQERVMTRVRIGHTKLTHSYIINGTPKPKCDLCINVHLTIKHIILTCPKFNTERRFMITYCTNNQLNFNFNTILGNNCPALHTLLLQFLRDIDIIDNI